MKESTRRSIFRWIHLVMAIPIAGYVYSPFEEIPITLLLFVLYSCL